MTNPVQRPIIARAFLFIRFATLGVLLALLWRLVDVSVVVGLLGQSDPILLFAALLVILGQNVLSAMRWRFTADRLGQSIGTYRAIAEYFLSQFLNLTLPAGMLGDAGRAIRMRKIAGLGVSGQAVIVDRVLGQMVLVMIVAVGFFLVLLTQPWDNWPDWVAPLGLWTLGAFALFALCLVIAIRFSRRMRSGASKTAAVLRRAVFSRNALPRQITLSLAILACNLSGFALCAVATGSYLPLLAVITILPLVLFTMVLPISVGGWGVREGAAAALWPVIGATSEAGVAASIAFGLVIMIASLPGVLTLVYPSEQNEKPVMPDAPLD